MPKPIVDFPVFDADNHMYETMDAFTKFLPPQYSGLIKYVEVNGRTKIAVRNVISEYIPNPTFNVVGRPGASEELFRNGNPEGKTRRDHARADIGRIPEVIGWIVRVGPGSVNRRRIVVRHVDRIGIGRLDDDHLLAFLRLNADLLLLGGDQLFAVVRFGAKALDRVHHIRLLREHGIAEILGPVELVAHHRNDVRRAGKRLDAVVPGLFVDLLLQGIALQILAFLQPAIGLHHLQWIGRCRQHICEQFVGIQRYRRNQSLELLGLQQFCTWRRLARRLHRIARSRWIVGRLCRDGHRDRHQHRERDQGLAAAQHQTLL